MADGSGTEGTRRDVRPADLSAEWHRAFDWVEGELGGRLSRIERQARWRPAWFLDLEREGESLPLYFRGDRGNADPGLYPLEHEMRVLEVLEAHGVPVPHVYGFCEDPRGILMQRCRGRANLGTEPDASLRQGVLDHYVEILAQMHGIDTAAFEAVGLARPPSHGRLAMGDFDYWERGFRKAKSRPEPLIEFAIGWLRRNLPETESEPAFIATDSGQFLFEDGRVTALLDLELAHIGDPVADLAGLFCRDLSEPLGDLAGAVQRYERLTARRVDRGLLDFHIVRWCLCTPLAVAGLVARPPAGLDFAQYLTWYWAYSRAPIEVMARRAGVPLAPLALPKPTASRHETAYRALSESLRAGSQGDDFPAYEAGAALRIAEHLERVDRFGPALEEAELADVAALLGRRPADALEADAALEAWVRDQGAERDHDAIGYFHRRCLRQEALLGPAMRELEGAAVQRCE